MMTWICSCSHDLQHMMICVAVIKCVLWCVVPTPVLYAAINKLYTWVQQGYWCGRCCCVACLPFLEICYFWIDGGLLFSNWSSQQPDRKTDISAGGPKTWGHVEIRNSLCENNSHITRYQKNIIFHIMRNTYLWKRYWGHVYSRSNIANTTFVLKNTRHILAAWYTRTPCA